MTIPELIRSYDYEIALLTLLYNIQSNRRTP